MGSEETAAIAAGCAIGGLVLLIVLISVLYLLCGKRKHDKRRDQKKFRHLSPHVSPTHSQPSTLGHMSDGHLPKVNSTGLWIEAPGMYAGSPSPAYYYGRPHGASKQRIEPFSHIPRAVSDNRTPQPRVPVVPSRPGYAAHNNVYLFPTHGGQRIYHSQPLAPVYEIPPTRGMEIYDVYQFAGGGPGGSRSKLLETRHTPQYYNDYGEFRITRLERSKSDAQERRSPRHELNNSRQSSRPRSSSQEKHGKSTSSKENSRRSNSSEGKKVSQSVESLKGGGNVVHRSSRGQENRAFAPDAAMSRMPPNRSDVKPASSPKVDTTIYYPRGNNGVVSTIVTTTDISPSATDSMKLLAKNKTDDQKTQPALTSLMTEKLDDSAKDIDYRHHQYQGDIYSTPMKTITDTNENDDNPILNRMKEMVVEKSRNSSNPSSPRESSNIPYEAFSPSTVRDVTSTGQFQEITKVTTVTKTEVIESFETVPDTVQQSIESKDKDTVDGLVLPELSELEKAQEVENTKSVVTQPASLGVEDTVAVAVVRESTPSPVPAQRKLSASPRLGLDKDGAEVGKEVTATAFKFLDTYLSDEEGGDGVDSPPLSPGGMTGMKNESRTSNPNELPTGQ